MLLRINWCILKYYFPMLNKVLWNLPKVELGFFEISHSACAIRIWAWSDCCLRFYCCASVCTSALAALHHIRTQHWMPHKGQTGGFFYNKKILIWYLNDALQSSICIDNKLSKNIEQSQSCNLCSWQFERLIKIIRSRRNTKSKFRKSTEKRVIYLVLQKEDRSKIRLKNKSTSWYITASPSPSTTTATYGMHRSLPFPHWLQAQASSRLGAIAKRASRSGGLK